MGFLSSNTRLYHPGYINLNMELQHSNPTFSSNPQDLITMDPSVYPYVCGYAVADGVLLPGETVRIEVDVDTDVCGDSALYSLVSMLGEFSLKPCTIP